MGNLWLGDMLKKIRNASSGDALETAQTHLSELEALNDYSKNFHHGQNQYADSHPIDDTELSGYVQRTLKLVTGF